MLQPIRQFIEIYKHEEEGFLYFKPDGDLEARPAYLHINIRYDVNIIAEYSEEVSGIASNDMYIDVGIPNTITIKGLIDTVSSPAFEEFMIKVMRGTHTAEDIVDISETFFNTVQLADVWEKPELIYQKEYIDLSKSDEELETELMTNPDSSVNILKYTLEDVREYIKELRS